MFLYAKPSYTLCCRACCTYQHEEHIINKINPLLTNIAATIPSFQTAHIAISPGNSVKLLITQFQDSWVVDRSVHSIGSLGPEESTHSAWSSWEIIDGKNIKGNDGSLWKFYITNSKSLICVIQQSRANLGAPANLGTSIEVFGLVLCKGLTPQRETGQNKWFRLCMPQLFQQHLSRLYIYIYINNTYVYIGSRQREWQVTYHFFWDLRYRTSSR